MYATTRYNFVHLKATHKISPLEELIGGGISPLAVPRAEVNRYVLLNLSHIISIKLVLKKMVCLILYQYLKTITNP
jgi:hypothetical protein